MKSFEACVAARVVQTLEKCGDGTAAISSSNSNKKSCVGTVESLQRTDEMISPR